MFHNKRMLFGSLIAGLSAGIVNGIFGAAGGMVLIPMLQLLARVPEKSLFPMSVSIMLPVCVISLLLTAPISTWPWLQTAPYLVGSLAGGCIAGLWGNRIPQVWLHRIFGIMIIWGGFRYVFG